MSKHVRLGLAGLLAVLSISALTFFPTYEAPKPVSPPEGGEGKVDFVTNEGQWEGPAAYRADLQRGRLWLEPQAWVYHFWEPPQYLQQHAMPRMFGKAAFTHPDSTEKGHVLRVSFPGSQAANIVPGKERTAYRNFFVGNDPDRWRGEVAMYGLLTYEELWPGIDMRVYSYGDAIKYDFVVAPGTDPASIQLKFDGADNLFLQDGKLVVETSVRTITELPPVAYQEAGDGREGVACFFDLDQQTLRFSLPRGYDKDRPLIIDPTLVFSTFTGSSDDNWGFTAAFDTAGNLYAGGILYDPVGGIPNTLTGYPTTTGAYSTVTQGGTFEVTLSKFDPTGANLVYSTLLGGIDDDRPHSLIINDAGELYVYGRTLSNNFPVANAYDSTHNGNADIFVARFNAAGSQLLGCTYVGGSNDDGVNENGTFLQGVATKYNYGDDARGEVMLDRMGEVYVASCTRSTNFPANNNAFQPNNAGQQDGVVFKLSPDLSTMRWASYLGGGNVDAAYGLIVDSAYTVYVTGGTASNNILGNLTGGRYPTYRGGRTDGFIVRIDSLGRNLLNGTYVGTNAYDQTFFIQQDINNNIYVSGQTESGAFPIANVLYRDQGAKQFIFKITPDLATTVYSTTFGDRLSNAPNISPTAMLVDNCENVYVTGWGGITNYQGFTQNMPLTSDAQQRTTDGSDFYLFVLARNGDSVLYATYFGGNNPGAFSGEHVDGGTSRFDRRGIVYHAVCANCGGVNIPGTTPNQSFPATVGAYSITNNSANCNLAAFKFDFGLTGISANFVLLDTSNNPLSSGVLAGCPPLTVNFDNTSTPSVSTRYFWEFGIVGQADTAFEPSFTYVNPGNYTVRLIIEDSTSCNIRDTAIQQILVYPYPNVEAGVDRIICLGDTVSLAATGSGDVVWEPAAFVAQPTQAVTSALPNANTRFIATLTDSNGCVIRDSLTVVVDSANWLSLSPGDTTICVGEPLQLNASAPPASSYFWEPEMFLDNPRLANPTVTLDSTRTFVVTVVDTNRCSATDSLEVTVYHSSAGGDTSICSGESTRLFATGGATYRWEPAALLDDPNAARPLATVENTTVFTALVTLPNSCIDTYFVEVRAIPPPDLTLSAPDSICPGGSTILEVGGAETYLWSPAGPLDDSTSITPVARPESTTTFTVTGTSAAGCVSDTTLEVFVRPPASIDAGPDRSVCGETSTLLQGSGAVSYQWTPTFGLDNPRRSNPRVTLLDDEVTYYLFGIDRYGCTGTDSVVVRQVEQPTTNILIEFFPCDRDSRVSLTALGGERVRWNDGNTNRTRIVAPQAPEIYIATAFIDDCAGIPDTIEVDRRDPFPVANFTASPVTGFAPAEVQFVNLSERAVRYEWDFGGVGKSEREEPLWGFVAGEFRVRLIAYSAEGCADTAFLDLAFENNSLHVPSAFTPNGDDVNDEFFIGSYGITTFDIRIYNRWGREVFSSNDPNFRWDGTFQGQPVPEGVYVYQLQVASPTGRLQERTGTITVIR